MASKKNTTGLLLLAAAAVGGIIWWKKSGADMPSVDFTNISWINGSADLIVNGQQMYLAPGTMIRSGSYDIGFTQGYNDYDNAVGNTALVITKNGTIYKTVQERF